MTGRPDPCRLAIAIGLIVTLVAVMAAMALVHGRKASAPKADRSASPLSGELRRCGDLGEKARGDARCRAAWDESRARFFGERGS